MQNKHTHIILVMTFLALACTATTAMSFDGHGGGPPNMDPETMQQHQAARMERMKILLDLSDAQQEMLEENRTAQREEGRAMREATQTLHAQLRDELQKTNLDTARIEVLRADLKTAMARMVDHRIDGILRVREILTPEQFSKFLAMEPGPGRGHGPKGRGMGRGMGMQSPPPPPPE